GRSATLTESPDPRARTPAETVQTLVPRCPPTPRAQGNPNSMPDGSAAAKSCEGRPHQTPDVHIRAADSRTGLCGAGATAAGRGLQVLIILANRPRVRIHDRRRSLSHPPDRSRT